MTDPTGPGPNAEPVVAVADPAVVRIERERLPDGREITYYSAVRVDQPGHDARDE